MPTPPPVLALHGEGVRRIRHVSDAVALIDVVRPGPRPLAQLKARAKEAA